MIRYNAPRPIQAPDYLGATTAQGIAANQRYGQKVSQQNANKSGLYGLGATALMKYGPALAKALSTQTPTMGAGIGTGVGGAPSMVASSSPEIASFMSAGIPGASGAASAGAPVGLGASGAGTAGATLGGTAAAGTAGALTAAELAAATAAAEAAGVSTATYLAMML